jgi:diguanylate cyclase (GGDEF)-like protein
MRDVTGERRSQERLLHDAVHDSLTGLPNRELFLDRLAGAVTRARLREGGRPTVFFVDIDRFKNVNRSLGLTLGDTMLLTVARRLSRQFKAQDTVARIGGDQFAILITSETDPRQIATTAERVRRTLRTPMKVAEREVILTGCIGIAVYDGKQSDPRDVLKEAEIAMFRAKRGGPDRIDIFTADLRGDEEERLPLESDLRRALERDQIRIVFQPIIHLGNDGIAGFEALLRWDHPKQGRLNPDDFLPVAEESGLMGMLGSYAVEKAVEHAAKWQQILPRDTDPLFVSVNISSRQLFRQELLQQIGRVLSSDIVPSGTLWLEVTESLVMENPEQAIEMMRWLKSAGARISLDDFGTGYSSLGYLNRFPIDAIKVDKTFVRDSDLNGSTPVILKSIVALAHELDKEVVAEGIETGADANYLRAIGCEYGQGFHYGEPLDERDVTRLLKALAKDAKKHASKTGSELVKRSVVTQMPEQPAPRAARGKRPALKPVSRPG